MPAECHSADERQPELTTKKIYMISILFPLFLDGIWFSGGSGMKRALKSPNRTTQNLFWERVALMTAKQQKNRERIMISWLDFWRRITSSGTTLFWKAQSHAHVRCEQCIKSKSIIIIVAFSLRYEFLNRCRTTLKISEHLLSPVLACTQRTTTRSYTAGRDRFPFFLLIRCANIHFYSIRGDLCGSGGHTNRIARCWRCNNANPIRMAKTARASDGKTKKAKCAFIIAYWPIRIYNKRISGIDSIFLTYRVWHYWFIAHYILFY